MKTLVFSSVQILSDEKRDYHLLGPWCSSQLVPEWDYFHGTISKEEIGELREKTFKEFYYLLPRVSERLNTECGTQENLEYWSLAIGFWLYYIIQYVTIRKTLLKKFLETYDKENFKIIPINFNKNNFQNLSHMRERTLFNGFFSAFVFTHLLKDCCPNTWEWDSSVINFKIDIPSVNNKKYTKKSFTSIKGMRRWDKIFFRMMLKIFSLKKIRPRTIKLQRVTESSFPDIDWNFFIDLFWLESFKSMSSLYQNSSVPKSFVDCGTLLHAREEANFYVAHLYKNNCSIALSQHGGLYGYAYAIAPHELLEISRFPFIFWGKFDPTQFSLPSVYLSEISKSRKKKLVRDKIVYVGTRIQSFPYYLYSMPNGFSINQILEEKINFIQNLRDDLLPCLTLSLYPKIKSDIDESEVLSHLKKDLKFSKTSADVEILDAKLVIIDHPVTTLLICVAANIPFVGIWHDKDWPTIGKFAEYIKELRELGLVFDNGIHAVNFVNENYHDIEAKWSSLAVQDVLNKIRNDYALTSSSWRKQWVDFLFRGKVI